jgi:hypothetical protein
LVGVLFDPEDGNVINLRNVRLSLNNMVLQHRRPYFSHSLMREPQFAKECLLPSVRCRHKYYTHEITNRPTAR